MDFMAYVSNLVQTADFRAGCEFIVFLLTKKMPQIKPGHMDGKGI